MLKKYCYDSQNNREWLEHLKTSHLNNSSLKVEEYENAIILPDAGKLPCFAGGIVDSLIQPIQMSFQRFGLQTTQELINNTDFNNINVRNETVYYIGQYRNHWGSFLIDTIPRLWKAIDHPEKYTYALLGTQTDLGGIHDNVYKFFSLFGIKKEQIIYITEPTQFTKIIIPELSYVPNRDWHIEYLDIIKKVVDNCKCTTVKAHERIYFSRSRFSKKSKTDFGEELIVKIMEDNGFHIVYPEECTLEEQIAYVNNCKVFSSVCGSCAHNIIFSFNKPKVFLFSRMNGYGWHQWMLNEMAAVDPINYVDAYREPYKWIFNTSVSGPYLYCITKKVINFLKDNDYVYYNKYKDRILHIGIFMRYSVKVFYIIGARIKSVFLGKKRK